MSKSHKRRLPVRCGRTYRDRGSMKKLITCFSIYLYHTYRKKSTIYTHFVETQVIFIGLYSFVDRNLCILSIVGVAIFGDKYRGTYDCLCGRYWLALMQRQTGIFAFRSNKCPFRLPCPYTQISPSENRKGIN